MIGGHSCLDFTNTVGGLRGRQSVDTLSDYRDLIGWATRARLIPKEVGRKLDDQATGNQRHAAARVFKRGIALREALYRIFSARAKGQTARSADLELFNKELAEAMRHVRLVPGGKYFQWELRSETSGIALPLHAVVRDAANLLTSERLAQVRECGSETCGWLFVDTSRNHSRRWCEMSVCGNRVKQARFRRGSNRRH